MNPGTDTPADIAALHALYQRLTGNELVLNWFRMDCWRQWISYRKHQPFTQEDLKTVVAYFRRTRKGGLLDGSLKFHLLIQQPDRFEEDLALCRQALRPRPLATKELVSCGIARVVPNQNMEDTSVQVGDLIRKMRLAADQGEHLA